MTRAGCLLLALAACSPSLPPEFAAGTTCEVERLGLVHLAYKASCSCVVDLHASARQVLSDEGLVPLVAIVPSTVWVYTAPPDLHGELMAGWYWAAEYNGPAIALDRPMDALAHELTHAYRIEHEHRAVEDEVQHLGWSDPRPEGRTINQVVYSWGRVVLGDPPCRLEP